MSTPDTFFVSEAIEDLFEAKPASKPAVHINDMWKGSFVSFSSRNRKIKFGMEVENPFNVVSPSELDIVIEFPSGTSRKIHYASFSYHIEENQQRYIITVEDTAK